MPDYEAFMLPILETLGAAPAPLLGVARSVADRLSLSDQDRAHRPAWAHEPLFVSRTRMAAESLAAAGLIARTDEEIRLEARGRELLQTKPGALSREALRQYPEFEAYLQAYLARQGA